MSSSSNIKTSLHLDWCSHEAAKYAVMNWHYSKLMPKSKLAKIGVWESGVFAGAVIYGVGAVQNIGKPFGLRADQACELVRVALSPNCMCIASKVLSISLRIVKRTFPNLQIVISYADINQDHVGTIYQASNWTYMGKANDDGGSAIVNGVEIHGRALSLKYGTRSLDWIRRNVDPSAKKATTLGKHKYLYPLTPEMRAKIAPLAKPYPKRALEAGDHPDQGQSDGAEPILTLQ